MLPDMTAEPKQQSAPQTLSAQPVKPVPEVAPSSDSNPSKTIDEAGANKPSDTGDPAKSDVVDHDVTSTKTVRSKRHFAHRSTGRSEIQQMRAASRTTPSARAEKADATVTVAANETEIGQLLRLASVVKEPPIRVVSAVASANGCKQKSADFVVDTMANPDRVGPAIPLFTEGLIIIARKDIHNLAGLRGRQVSFGMQGGSSQRVADRVFRSLAIDVHEVPLDLDNALDGLSQGGIDAVALLAPRGFDRLAGHDSQMHLLPLPDRLSPPDGLKLSRIDPSSYLGGTWSTPSLSVVTVDAVLSPSRAAQMQPNAQAVYAALDRRSSELAANGFDLIGGNGGLATMRSSAKEVSPEAVERRTMDSGC